MEMKRDEPTAVESLLTVLIDRTPAEKSLSMEIPQRTPKAQSTA